MRLDSHLVEIGNLGSRSRAKRAIIEGHVRVNDKVITKPSFDVGYSDKIEITSDLDRPAGYWKLKDIQERTNLIKNGDRVLDIGSSAGGFLLFACEIASSVHGIEFSHEFRPELKKIAHEKSNITVEFADVFTIAPGNEIYDVLLLDITVSPLSSIKALLNVFPSLKNGGRLLHVLKIPKSQEIESILEKLTLMGFKIQQVIEAEKQEAYIIARKLK
jgi:23S rRNA (cytidine1920-2'-O)/16S rRNA (cytidine1409-2'-O)-methyltransferase